MRSPGSWPRCPSDILIAIDEAYVEYIRDGLAAGQLRTGPRSRQRRCAAHLFEGIRAGRTAHRLRRRRSGLITALGKVYVPFTATSVSQAAAIASLDAADELLARTDAVVAERTRVSTALRAAGFTVPPSQANFVWLPLAERTMDFVNSAADNRLLVRPYGQDGVRVTVALRHENDAFLEFATRWIGAP